VALDDRLAAAVVLRDLEQVYLVDGERLAQRSGYPVGERFGRTRAARGARDAVERFRRGASVPACGGVEYGSAFPGS
jgi:hypothetical protein